MQINIFSTLFVGQNLIKLSEVDSTNNFLKIMVSNSEPLPEGTVIMADYQSAGRGQQENKWSAESGMNLTFSIFLKPVFLQIKQQFLLNKVISIALKDTLGQALGEGIKIKWPNDIYYFNKKIGGVLIENIIAGSTYKAGIIGIGININQEKFDGELANKATSICQILKKNIDLIKLLAQICTHIESGYLKLKSGTYTSLHSSYVNNLYKLKEKAYYRQNGEIIEGEIIDVTEEGQLVILTEGVPHKYNFKEIEFLGTHNNQI